MTADTLKGNGITNLDGSNGVITTNSPDGYGPGYDTVVSDWVTPTTGGLVSTSSTYRLVRLPSDAVLKNVTLRVKAKLDTGGASAAFLVDAGAYYSDSTTDGGPSNIANAGAVISANCFVAAKSFGTTADAVATGVASKGDFQIDGMSALDPNLLGSPLWKQAGLSADPGGFIDYVLAVHTAANTAQASNIGIVLEYTR